MPAQIFVFVPLGGPLQPLQTSSSQYFISMNFASNGQWKIEKSMLSVINCCWISLHSHFNLRGGRQNLRSPLGPVLSNNSFRKYVCTACYNLERPLRAKEIGYSGAIQISQLHPRRMNWERYYVRRQPEASGVNVPVRHISTKLCVTASYVDFAAGKCKRNC